MILLLLLAQLIGPELPDKALTPGVVNPKITQALACSIKWGQDARAVTEAMKVEVATRYKIPRTKIVGYNKGPCCEFDHLISRELGGADDVKNLWPQWWAEAKKKDQLENYLHRQVCTGKLTLSAAQITISTDWVKAFQAAGLK